MRKMCCSAFVLFLSFFLMTPAFAAPADSRFHGDVVFTCPNVLEVCVVFVEVKQMAPNGTYDCESGTQIGRLYIKGAKFAAHERKIVFILLHHPDDHTPYQFAPDNGIQISLTDADAQPGGGPALNASKDFYDSGGWYSNDGSMFYIVNIAKTAVGSPDVDFGYSINVEEYKGGAWKPCSPYDPRIINAN